MVKIDHVGMERKKVIIFLIIIVVIVKYSKIFLIIIVVIAKHSKARELFHIIVKYQRITEVAQGHAGSSAARHLSNTTTERHF